MPSFVYGHTVGCDGSVGFEAVSDFQIRGVTSFTESNFPLSTTSSRSSQLDGSQSNWSPKVSRRSRARGLRISRPKISDEELPYACTLCPKRYKLKASVEDHMKSHASTGENTCPACGRLMSRQRDLKRHMANVHGIVLPVEPTGPVELSTNASNVLKDPLSVGESHK